MPRSYKRFLELHDSSNSDANNKLQLQSSRLLEIVCLNLCKKADLKLTVSS